MSWDTAGRGPSAAPILRRRATIAVVGASANPARASNFVLTYLLSSSADYEVWPVTPNETEILGVQCYPSLAELPGDAGHRRRLPPRRPAAGASRARRSRRARARSGCSSACTATRRPRSRSSAGLDVVSNRCVKIEHARFHGGLHLAGFDTGVISSRAHAWLRRSSSTDGLTLESGAHVAPLEIAYAPYGDRRRTRPSTSATR